MIDIPDDLKDLIEELVIIDEEYDRKEREDFGERLYDYREIPKPEEKPIKIEISLE